MKKLLVISICLLTGWFLLTGTGAIVCAAGERDISSIEPEDFDFVAMVNNQSRSVSAGLNFPLDFQLIPVVLYGNGPFSASMSRTNTKGEIVYMYLLGFGTPNSAFNIGVTPVTMRVSSTISSYATSGYGLIVTGILYSPEQPPYSYNVNLTF
jgi:hypothetical protein